MRNILIIGATSAIAEAVARHFAAAGDRLFLCARNTDRLTTLASDLEIRGSPQTQMVCMDINALENHQDFLNQAFDTLGTVDVVLIAHGTLPDQKACEQSVQATLAELNTNSISTLALLTELANRLERQGSGTIAVITSVAGDRGRQSNYVYGAAKGMVSVFLQGLRNRLYRANVHVLDIRPGFVDTPMTAAFPKGLLWAQPDTVARSIVNAIERRRNTLYTPAFWAMIMLIIRLLPEALFKKLRL